MMGKFIRYNLVVGITFLISYLITILAIDVLNNPAWLIVPIVSLTTHILRYLLLFPKESKNNYELWDVDK